LLRACKTITKPKPCFSKKTTEDSVAPSVGGRFIVSSFKGSAAPGCAVDSAAPAEEAIGVEILTQCALGPGIFALDMVTEYAVDSDLTNNTFQFFQLNGTRLQTIVDQLSFHPDHQPKREQSNGVATRTAFDPDSQNPCAADWPHHTSQKTINKHQKTVQNTVIRFVSES
jgi:hypothetical protein